MTTTMAARLMLSAALLFSAGACSVASYEKPIAKFSTATVDAERALVGLNGEAVEIYSAVQEQRIVARALQPRLTAGCQDDPAPCRLELIGRSGQPEGALPLQPPLQKMIVLMRSIRNYAENLNQIVVADTAANVEASVDATVASLKKLSETATKLRPQAETAPGETKVDLAQYITPAGSAVNWLLGQYIASIKLDGLKRATKDAIPVVSEATELFADSANTAGLMSGDAARKAMRERNDALGTSPTGADVKALLDSVVAYNALKSARPADVFARMNAAHAALVDKIQGGNLSLSEVIVKIEDFAAEAQNLIDIVESLRAVGVDSASAEK